MLMSVMNEIKDVKNVKNPMMNEKNAVNVGTIHINELVVSRREISMEILNHTNLLHEARLKLATNGHLSKEENKKLLDKMIEGMNKLNEYTIKFDRISIR